MKRLMLALLSAAAVSIAVVPAAQASAATAVPARAVAQTGWRHVALSPAECAALARPAGCAGFESTRLSVVHVNTSATTEFWSGYMQACAVVYSTGGCATNNWWVSDNFNFTTNYNTGQAWNNGAPECQTNPKYTTVKWCSYTGNGTTAMQEGFNFGNGGWARMNLTGEGTSSGYSPCTSLSAPSWANVSGHVYSYVLYNGYTC